MKYQDSRQDITALVKEQTDIVKIIGEQVELKKSGVRYLGLCPFHNEKTPSFSVHGDQQFFHCFGCGESGDVFSFLMKYHNLDFPSALKDLADRLNIELPKKEVSEKEKQLELKRTEMFGVTEKVCEIYHAYLSQSVGGGVGRRYLEDRRIPEKVWKAYQIGYAPAVDVEGWEFLTSQLTSRQCSIAREIGLLVKSDRGGNYDRFRDRILFPIHDARGRVCGFGGRIVGDGQPKYMNSPESLIYNKSRSLLGYYQQQQEIRRKRSVVIVEGNFDMISLVVGGVPNVVAPLGTAITQAQVKLLGRQAEEAILLFDGDEAGIKAAQRAAPLFLAANLHARVALLPQGHDPDTFIQEKGAEELQSLLNGALELPEFSVSKLMEEHGLTLEGKSKIIEEIKPLVSAASTELQRSVIIAHFGEKLGIDPQQLETSLVREKVVRRDVSEKRAFLKSTLERRSQGQLTPPQKRLVEYMILHPASFSEFEQRDVRAILQGGIGEIIYLQIKEMTLRNKDIQPEEILSSLPEGAERKLVADLLLNASNMKADSPVEGNSLEIQELNELVNWLEHQEMRRISEGLIEKISLAQKQNDFEALANYLNEKQIVEQKMRKLGK